MPLRKIVSATVGTRSKAGIQIDLLVKTSIVNKKTFDGCFSCLTEDHESIEKLAHELIVKVRAIAAKLT
ncbi:hypothetical protein [Anatilimnocola aggregata]|uniref:hypothetical protein n=1 Tax=Anatilimnocola aggregata TaxID=2528021 RepID=UPI0011AA5AC8|nr:hypothetical protein [Anatilimnocola aggregata]